MKVITLTGYFKKNKQINGLAHFPQNKEMQEEMH